jgi:hypothetical protein
LYFFSNSAIIAFCSSDGVSQFFGGGSMSIITVTDLLHDMVVALFSYLFK